MDESSHPNVASLEDPRSNVAKADVNKVAQLINHYEDKVSDAANAHEQDKQLHVWDALKKHKKAVFWSMALSTSLVMEGYDLVIINSFYGQEQFQRKYGTLTADGKYAITAPWQTGLSNSALVGQIIGLAINGYLSQRIGYRKTMMGAMVFMAAAIFIVFFAPSLPVLAFAEAMCGLPWGVFQTLSTAYAADICPISLRPLLTSYVNMCWGFGILISSGVARAAIDLPGSKAYKLPFALQWIWPVPLFLVAYFCPESPYWLIRKGRREEAIQSLVRLSKESPTRERECERHAALLEHTDAIERAETEGTSYLDCFRGVNRRRTEIACAIFAFQWWSGNPLIGFAVTFLQQAGFDETKAFDFNLGMNCMYTVGTIISFFLIPRFGRRTIYIAGLIFMALVCMAVGISGFVGAPGAVGGLMVLMNFAYNISIGPLCYAIIAEIGSARLRPLTVVLARISYNITGIIVNVITPRMIQPTTAEGWGWGARCGIFWMGTTALCAIYCILRLPETKGRSFGELDVLFANHVPAWRFKKTEVDLFENNGAEATIAQQSSESHEKIHEEKKY